MCLTVFTSILIPNSYAYEITPYRGFNGPSDLEMTLEIACPDRSRSCAQLEFLRIIRKVRHQNERKEYRIAVRYYTRYIRRNYERK